MDTNVKMCRKSKGDIRCRGNGAGKNGEPLIFPRSGPPRRAQIRLFSSIPLEFQPQSHYNIAIIPILYMTLVFQAF